MEEKFSKFTFFQGDYLKTFRPDKYNFKREDVDFERMYEDIADFIRMAINGGYQIRIWSDEYCVVIEYNDQDESLSGVTLEWLGENEYVAEYGCCEKCAPEEEPASCVGDQ